MAIALGDQLRHAREERGFSLSDLSALTKIPVRALQALEAEAFDRLPPGIFRRSYLRSFATAVGLDAEECVHAYIDRCEPPAPLEPPSRLASWSDNRLRALLGVIVVVVGLVAMPLVGALWRAINPDGASGQDAGAPAGASAPQAPSHAASSVAPLALRMELQATSACWISATADDVRAVRRLVRAGETVTIDAASAIVLNLGDAGAVTYTINGAPGRALGTRGELVTVRITPQTYAALLVAGTVAQRAAR